MVGYPDHRRTYGGWRLSRGMGILGAGPGGSMVLLVTWIVQILMGGINIVWYLYLGPITALITAGVLVRWEHDTLANRVTRAVRWWWANVSRFTTFSLVRVVDSTGASELPGLLAALRLLDVDDGYGRRFGLVHDQRSGYLTATFRVDARTTALVDADQVDRWVAGWGAFLANLGLIPMIKWVATTIETAPEPGTTLAESIESRIDPNAPLDALTLLMDLLKKSPEAAADVDTRVSITFDPSSGLVPLRELSQQVGEVSRLLVALESSLAGSGVGVLGRCSAAEIAGIVTTAFHPDQRGEVNRLLSAPDPTEAERALVWEHTGPVTATEYYDAYRHDGNWSVSWGWVEAPRQQVESDILRRLLAPSRFIRRVTIFYRPFSAVEAPAELERQVNAANFRQGIRRKQGIDEKARDQADREQARQAASEEAHGAGVVRMSVYVTTTVQDESRLLEACGDVEARAQESKIRLRRLRASQAAGFALTLPIGAHPVEMALRGRR